MSYYFFSIYAEETPQDLQTLTELIHTLTNMFFRYLRIIIAVTSILHAAFSVNEPFKSKSLPPTTHALHATKESSLLSFAPLPNFHPLSFALFYRSSFHICLCTTLLVMEASAVHLVLICFYFVCFLFLFYFYRLNLSIYVLPEWPRMAAG